MNTKDQLPDGWVETTLDNICTIVMGQSPPSSEYNDRGEGLPFFQGKAEFTDFYPQVRKWCSSPVKIAEKEDILLSIRAPVGPTNIAPSQCCIGRGLAAIRPEGSINFRYILYSIRNFNDSLTKLATGSTFEAISGDDIRAFEIPLPPLPEQTRIVTAIEEQFTRLDDAVASLKSAQAQIPQYRASLLQSAVSGDLTEQWRAEHPAEEMGEQLLQRILSERRRRWEEEELAKMRERGELPRDNKWKQKYKEPQEPDTANLPELPEGWCWATVEQLADISKHSLAIGPFGSDLKVEDYRSEGVPLVFVRNIRSQTFNGPDTKYISFEKYSDLQAHTVVGK